MKPLLYAAFIWASFALPANAADWPGWRGPTGDGITTETNLPVHWSATENVLWKVEVEGAGVSAPVVSRGRVFLTASDGRLNDRLHVLCYDAVTGKQLWHRRFFGSAQPEGYFTPGGMAVPTVAADGQRLFALFGTGDLFCLDFDGRPIWLRSLAEEYGPFRNRWGMGTSPILAGDCLVVQVDHWGESYLLAVDATTGANRWKTKREASVNWSSPLIVDVKGRRQVVATGTHEAKGYDLANGEELWTVTGLQLECIPTPIRHGDLVYVVSGRKGHSIAIRLDDRRGDITATNVVWKKLRGASYVPSPVCYQGRYYLIDDNGLATCLNAASGDEIWQERVDRKPGRYHASPVSGDGKIYCTSLEGVVSVLRAGPNLEVLSRNDLGEGIVATPAIASGRIYIRGERHLFCVGK